MFMNEIYKYQTTLLPTENHWKIIFIKHGACFETQGVGEYNLNRALIKLYEITEKDTDDFSKKKKKSSVNRLINLIYFQIAWAIM